MTSHHPSNPEELEELQHHQTFKPSELSSETASGHSVNDQGNKKAKSDDKHGENSSLKTEGESGGLGSFSCGTCGSQISSSQVYSSLPSETLSRGESSSASRRPLTAIESLMGHPQRNTLETDRVTTSKYTSHFTS